MLRTKQIVLNAFLAMAFNPKVFYRTRTLLMVLVWPSFCPKLRSFQQDHVGRGIALVRNRQSSSQQAVKMQKSSVLREFY